eukprot:1160978-Pelagomonas_calceolata.AAC.11
MLTPVVISTHHFTCPMENVTSLHAWGTAISALQAEAIAGPAHLTGTISSIFKIMRTHSVARVTAEDVTSMGCTTFSSSMLVIVPCATTNCKRQKMIAHRSCSSLGQQSWEILGQSI